MTAAAAELPLRAELHPFRSRRGAHVLTVDGSRVYDLDDGAAAAIDVALAGGSEVDHALRDGLRAAGLLVADAAARRIGDEPLAPPPLQSVSLNVAQACNMSCGYCYADEGRFGGAARVMDVATARAVVDRLIAESAPGSTLVIGYMGGEPLLNRRVVHETTAYAVEAAREAGRRARFSITTNATVIRPEDAALFAEHPFTVAVSVDGARAQHDRVRRMRGAGSAYDRMRAGLDVLERHGRPKHLAARITVTPRTGPLVPLLDHVLSLGFDEAGFAAVVASPLPGLAMGPADFAVFLREMIACGERALAEIGAGRSYPFGNLETALQEIHRGSHRPYPCGAGAAYLSANADGSLFACHRLVDDPEFAMGSAADGSDVPARAAHLARRHVDRQEPCRTCWARYLCGGGCYHEVERRGRPGCDYIRGWLDFCLRAYVELTHDAPSHLTVGGSGADRVSTSIALSHYGENMATTGDPSAFKIFPRNLTARAEYVVRGNPPTTRPESGVDNCYPGLEFDQRNLDKQFFPGLVFEFHHGDGARLHAFAEGPPPPAPWIRDGDPQLWLWAIAGRTRVEQEDAELIAFNGLGGLEVWRRVHDLLPGRVAIMVGAAPGRTSEPAAVAVRALLDAVEAGPGRELRFRDGSLYATVLAGDRAPYLDPGGVIDLDVYEPGDLTRSLCAPWQYDFRDCGCFYWAASKPDLVTSADGEHPYLNFQRRDRSSDPPPADVPPFDDRTRQELGYAELVGGAWNDLPVVLNDRESREFAPPGPVPLERFWTREEVAQELRYLATVEHALAVEYLYSHYSLRAPMLQPAPEADPATRAIFAAGYEVFLVAVDEMRHMRWANEALGLLGEGASVGRAERLGRELDHPFELRPLTPEQLQWYVDVEAPSQAIGEGIDGMYVRLHVSIDRQPELFPERGRLVPLIKLIIDEGEGHYERFQAVQAHLADLPPAQYLRELGAPAPGSQDAALADLADAWYASLLGTLSVAFALGDRGGGVLIEQSRRAMYNLHETSHRVAGRGVAPRFTLPPGLPAPLPVPDERRIVDARAPAERAREASDIVDGFADALDAALGAVAQDDDADVRAMAERHAAVRDDLVARLRAAIGDAPSG